MVRLLCCRAVLKEAGSNCAPYFRKPQKLGAIYHIPGILPTNPFKGHLVFQESRSTVPAKSLVRAVRSYVGLLMLSPQLPELAGLNDPEKSSWSLYIR